MMKLIMWSICALAALPLTLSAGDDADARKELKSLEGTWKVVAISEGGKEFPNDKIPAISFVFRADGTLTAQTPQGETKYTVTLDPGKKPKRIDITHESGPEKGKKQHTIYKLEGDKFTIFATQPGAPEGIGLPTSTRRMSRRR